MRTSLNDIKQTEDFLLGKLPAQESLVYKAKMILNPLLRWDTVAQEKTYQLVRFYSRRKLKSEIKLIQEKIFTDPKRKSFHQLIAQLFSKSK